MLLFYDWIRCVWGWPWIANYFPKRDTICTSLCLLFTPSIFFFFFFFLLFEIFKPLHLYPPPIPFNLSMFLLGPKMCKTISYDWKMLLIKNDVLIECETALFLQSVAMMLKISWHFIVLKIMYFPQLTRRWNGQHIQSFCALL